MKGTARPISPARRLLIDLMRASVPLVSIERTMKLDRLVTARASLAMRPGWAAMIAKAYCIVARDEPWLRTFYLKWPLPHFYEVARSVVTIAVIRDAVERDAIVFLKVGAADELPLQQVQNLIELAKHGPLDRVPSVQRQLRIARMPLPLRRLIWMLALNIGRLRANYLDTVGITSTASFGSELTAVRAPGPSVISYGIVNPDHTMKVLLHWDHRIYDGALAARALRRLEDVLNTEIADELRQNPEFEKPMAGTNPAMTS